MNQQTMILDINKYPAVIEPLYLRQGDKNGTTLRVTILDDGEPFYIGSYGVRLCLSIRDTYYEVEGVANENIAEFLIDESYLQYHGYSLNNYVSVYDGDTVICSTNSFKMVVYADSSSEADPAEIFTNGVQEFLEESEQQVNEAVDRANQAAEAAEGIVLQDVPLMTETIRGGAQIGGSTQTKSGKLEIKLTDSATGETVTCPSASYLARMEKDGMATQNGTPTPDNQIPIQVVEGANLLDTSGVSTYYATVVDASFTLAANVPGRSITIPITLEAGTYTISYEIPNGGITSTGNIVKPTNTNWLTNTVTSRTFTLSQDTAFGTLYFSSDCTVTQGAVINIMLVKGSVPQPYVPYGALGLAVTANGQTTVTPIPLDGNVLASLPDGTKDTLAVDPTGHVTLTKNTGMAELETLTWIYSNNRSYTYDLEYLVKPQPNLAVVFNAFCSSRRPISYEAGLANNHDGIALDSTRQRIITYAADSSDTPTGMLYYQLSTPTTVDLGYIDMPELEDDCTIEVVSSLQSSMTATWWTNEAAPIPEAINAIKDLIGGDTQDNTQEVLQVPNLRESLRVDEDTDEQPEGIETEGE